MNKCIHCKRFCFKSHNYCSWDCQIKRAKAIGGKLFTPNNLPIGCITCNGTMLECENGDHPDYIFPVEVINFVDGYSELHALIYFDSNICLTLGDGSYNIFHLSYDKCLTCEYLRLSEESTKKILAYNK